MTDRPVLCGQVIVVTSDVIQAIANELIEQNLADPQELQMNIAISVSESLIAVAIDSTNSALSRRTE